MSTIVFRTLDGVEYAVPADSHTPLLSAAQAQGYVLVSMCRHGHCGTCRSQLVRGKVHMSEHSSSALSEADEQAGGVLLCCGYADTDALIELPYDSSRVGSATVPVRQVKISALDFWPGEVARLVVAAVEDPMYGTAIQFNPGQFAELTPPGGTQFRAYSFASAANQGGTAEFYIKLHQGGYFSDYLTGQAKIGDVLRMRGPQGAFRLHENGPRPRWMVCGGTGLAPAMSMLRRMAERGETQEALLIFGVNCPDEVFAVGDMAGLGANLPSLRTVVTVTEPDPSWTGAVGTAADILGAELASRAPGAEFPDIYLCGPPAFLDAAQATAVQHMVPAAQIYDERAS